MFLGGGLYFDPSACLCDCFLWSVAGTVGSAAGGVSAWACYGGLLQVWRNYILHQPVHRGDEVREGGEGREGGREGRGGRKGGRAIPLPAHQECWLCSLCWGGHLSCRLLWIHGLL